MKKFLSVMLGVTLALGSATCVLMANEPEKHEKKEEHPKGAEHKTEHAPEHAPEHTPAQAPEHK